jgi:hypothetical protein
MKTMKLICLSLLVLTGILPGARGEPLRTDINPALLYYQAFLEAPPPMSETDLDYFYSKAGQEQKLPERYARIVAGYDAEFKLLRQAAQQKVPCDWGIDSNSGQEPQFPHWVRAKAAAQAAQLRAVWELQHGNETDASDDLLAAFVLGRNVSRDGSFIGALVQDAIEAIDVNTVAAHFGQFPPETLKQLVDGFDAAPVRGTVSAAMLSEKFDFHDVLVAKILEWQKAYPGNDAEVMAECHKIITETGITGWGDASGETNLEKVWEEAAKAAGGTSAGLLKLVDDVQLQRQHLAQIMALPHGEYENQLEQFTAEIGKSSNPFVARVLGYAPARKTREFRAQAQLAMLHAAMEYKLHGEYGLNNVRDPFGNGPFHFRRFVFEGVDRGFQLTSAYTGLGYPCALIFVEKEGAAFRIDGPHEGQAVSP